MKPQIMSALESVAYAAKFSQVPVISHYHATYASDIVSHIKEIHQCTFLDNESFGSAVNAAMGSEMGGVRSMVLSSSPKSADEVALASYSRLPLIIANVSRPLGAFSMKQDHSDVLSLRDAGALIFMPESNTDLVESIVQAYKVAEDQKVMLPAIVNIDFPHLSETVQMPNEPFVRRFLLTPKLLHRFDQKKPSFFPAPEENYQDYKKHQHRAMRNAVEVIEKVSLLWKEKFKTQLPLVEAYKTEGADLVLVMAGYHSPTAKAAVDNLRKQGKKVGLLRLRVVRPWPADQISSALKNAKKVAVYDQAVSLGANGVLYSDVKHAADFCSSFIVLGRHPDEKDFAGMFDRLDKSQKEETAWL